MTYLVGQALFGKVRFKDGEMPGYARWYLVVKANDTEVGLLNASSSQNKERKTAWPSNYPLKQFYPPFAKDTFIKLDSYVTIPITEANLLKLKCNGLTLNDADLNHILQEYPKYNK